MKTHSGVERAVSMWSLLAASSSTVSGSENSASPYETSAATHFSSYKHIARGLLSPVRTLRSYVGSKG